MIMQHRPSPDPRPPWFGLTCPHCGGPVSLDLATLRVVCGGSCDEARTALAMSEHAVSQAVRWEKLAEWVRDLMPTPDADAAPSSYLSRDEEYPR
jgi:hypothetical protein